MNSDIIKTWLNLTGNIISLKMFNKDAYAIFKINRYANHMSIMCFNVSLYIWINLY